MKRYHSPDKKKDIKMAENIRYPIVQKKSYAYTPKQNQYYQHKLTLQPTSELLSFLIMKEKHLSHFQHKEIPQFVEDSESLQLSQSDLINRKKAESLVNPLKILPFDSKSDKHINIIRKGLLDKKQALQTQLQINTVSQGYSTRHSHNPSNQIQLIRRIKYQKKLQPLKLSQLNKKMSNNIRDYISVEKIPIKQSQDSYLLKSKMYQKYHLEMLLHKQQQFKKQIKEVDGTKSYELKKKYEHINLEKEKNIIKRRVIFKQPFPMYYYRDFIWKVAYSNQHIVQVPEQYEQKIKYYVGPGNNSNLIKGIMNRRTWFQLTDKVQDAQLIWTQIKANHIFSQQKSGLKIIQITKQQLTKMTTKQQANKDQALYTKKYKILNILQNLNWNNYWSKYISRQNQIKAGLQGRSKCINQQQIQLSKRQHFKIHNHFCNNFIIGNKKALFKTMSQYYKNSKKNVFDYLPLTFHIKEGLEDQNYLEFLKNFYAIAKENKNNSTQSINKFNAWIVKPGENTNRGNGIIVCLTLNQIKAILKSKEKHQDGTIKTYILQKYIEKPLLYKKRKFDLRHYMMINCMNGRMKGYWYRQGYVRTTSSEYTLKASDGSIHLTNDAVQKYLPDYGKFERGNKATYEQLHNCISKQDPSFNFFDKVYPRMREIATDAIKASALNIDPQRKNNNFEIFGLDFMIDQHYNVWLIQINTNPCLQTGCPVLSKIIPKFIENTIEICIDPLFPAPLSFSPKSQQFTKNVGQQNNYDLVFDQRIDGIVEVNNNILDNPQQDDDIFDDDGQDYK